MKNPLVSMIVPVYNAQAYLPDTLESLRSQTYPDLEILLIDDGSTDDSGKLCRQMARKDPRFRILSQENQGVSAARNHGLDQAQGMYIQFADADDLLVPEATATFVHTAESTGCDLAVSWFYRVQKERSIARGHIKGERVMTRREFAEEMVKAPANYYYGVLWNKFFRRTLIEANRLRFDTQISWCEDFLFNLEYLQFARLIATIPQPLYSYIKRPGSLVTTQANLRNTIQTKRLTFAYYKELYQNLDLYEEKKGQIYRYFISSATDGAVPPIVLGGEKQSRRSEVSGK
ncbi:MAG: glycosyltransferase family 2 protein [Oscillospiraceae bacterium]